MFPDMYVKIWENESLNPLTKISKIFFCENEISQKNFLPASDYYGFINNFKQVEKEKGLKMLHFNMLFSFNRKGFMGEIECREQDRTSIITVLENINSEVLDSQPIDWMFQRTNRKTKP